MSTLIDRDLVIELARHNAGIDRARREAGRDYAVDPTCAACTADTTCPPCRTKAQRYLTVATSEEECAHLLDAINRPTPAQAREESA